MTEKRYTTVELPKPNNWGIWYDGNYLSTYEACHLLNEQQDEIGQLEKSIEQLRTIIDDNIDFNSLFSSKELSDICNETGWELSGKSIKLQQLEKENEELKQVLGTILLEVKRDITNINQTGEIRVFINPNSFNLISEVLRKYGVLKEWYE